MPKVPQKSWRGREFPLDKHLKDIRAVRVSAIEEELVNRGFWYVQVKGDNGEFRIRCRCGDIRPWIEHHFEQQTLLDFTIFPYKWDVGSKLDVVNIFVKAKVHKLAT
jgi:hypothetical protein